MLSFFDREIMLVNGGTLLKLIQYSIKYQGDVALSSRLTF